jgi:hypothetical protein
MVALAAVAVTAVGFSRLGDDSPTTGSSVASPSTPTATLPSTSTAAASMQATLENQAGAVSGRHRSDYLASWEQHGSARRQAHVTYANLVRLGVTDVMPRLSLPSVRGHATTWIARVDVSWRPDPRDASPATTALSYTFTAARGRMLVSAIAPIRGDREPIWLLPGLEVRRGARTLVAASSLPVAHRVERLLRGAVIAVQRVLPGWHGRLVAYAPASMRDFAALLAARPGEYAGIAAVTTTVDGSGRPGVPSAIVVSPRVFGGLGPISAHVVITHEATHVATDAAAVSMPEWLAEGFADYVAIGSVRLPVAVAAKAVLGVVRRGGAPQSLPQDADFETRDAGLEATYEEAWLATSLIARRYGQHRLVVLYRFVEHHPDDLQGAFRQILHTSVPGFTASWRGYLEGLARVG